jgi:hypothetical protein
MQYVVLILISASSQLYNCVQSAPVPAPERDFLINGWRWHTRAAVREAGRLRHVALSARTSDAKSAMPARLAKCYSYVWSFVFVKLHMIEIDIFFPWLRQNLPSEVCLQQALSAHWCLVEVTTSLQFIPYALHYLAICFTTLCQTCFVCACTAKLRIVPIVVFISKHDSVVEANMR